LGAVTAGASSTSGCETECIRNIFTVQPILCRLCHNNNPGGAALTSGGLDLQSDGFTARLKDVPAQHSDIVAPMTAADCPVGDKLIDTANPAESWLLKKIDGQQGNCGTPMPSTGMLSSTQQDCVHNYVACVAAAGTDGGPQLGVQVQPPSSYIILSATDAVAGPTPAPAVWTSATCATCHGSVGQGVNLLAPEVRHLPATYAQYVVRHGRLFNGMQTGMVAYPTTSADPLVPAISDADLTTVITWLDQQPRPTTGQGLFLDFCGNCHGRDGAGGIQPVKVTGETIATVNQKVRVGEGMDPSMRNAFMPAEAASALSDAELALIEQFIGAK